jgi:putative nucleotidyltransferase with HDIG domain
MRTLKEHDLTLYRHSMFVGDLTAAFSAYLGFSPADQSLLVRAALLHDLGKAGVSPDVLGKPGALNPREMKEMRSHPQTGYLLLTAEGGHDPETLAVVGQHHERLDGSGYPHGLLAGDISDPVRIVTLCDIYAAMTELRSYCKPLRPQEALRLIEASRTQLDLRLTKEFAAMATTQIIARAANWAPVVQERLTRNDGECVGDLSVADECFKPAEGTTRIVARDTLTSS